MIAPLATVAAALSGGATLSLPPSVAVTPTGKATLAAGDLRLPVARGELDGVVRLAGGARLARDGRRVALSSFELDGRRLTATVDGINRRVVFRLREPEVTAGPITTRTRSAVRGTPALTLGTPLVAGRLRATVTATFLALAGGQTELQLDPSFRETLAAEQITPGGAEGAPLSETGAIAFPIRRGRLAARGLEGVIEHGGGLTLSKRATPVVQIEDFRVDTRADGIGARFNDGDRQALFTATLPPGTLDADVVSFAGAPVALTQLAADALNGAFETGAFSAGQAVGVATVRAQLG